MRIQVLLSMGQDRLSKEEAGEILDQRVHVITSTQELRHSTKNFVKLTGDYLGEEILICLSMGTWPRHIERFERQYNKAFTRNPLFVVDLMDCIHKYVQVFLHSCNTTTIEDVEFGDLEEFGGLQKKVERGEWLTSTSVWLDRPSKKEEGRRKLDRNGMGARPSGGGGESDAIFNYKIDPQLHIMERLGDIKGSARSENLGILLAADVREICLRFLSKGN